MLKINILLLIMVTVVFCQSTDQEYIDGNRRNENTQGISKKYKKNKNKDIKKKFDRSLKRVTKQLRSEKFSLRRIKSLKGVKVNRLSRIRKNIKGITTRSGKGRKYSSIKKKPSLRITIPRPKKGVSGSVISIGKSTYLRQTYDPVSVYIKKK